MKIMTSLMMAFLLSITFISCSKSNDSNTNPSNGGGGNNGGGGGTTTANLVGTYVGKQGNGIATPNFYFKFKLQQDGKFIRYDEQGSTIGNGTWTFANNKFNATYQVTSNGKKYDMGASWTASTSKLSGTWKQQDTELIVSGQFEVVKD